jgi:hypothetical protein
MVQVESKLSVTVNLGADNPTILSSLLIVEPISVFVVASSSLDHHHSGHNAEREDSLQPVHSSALYTAVRENVRSLFFDGFKFISLSNG